MTSDQIIQELERYRYELSEIMGRFIRFTKSYDISPDDDPRLRTYITEIIDLLNDSLGDNKYSKTIQSTYQAGISNYLETPSYKSIEDIVSEIDSVITRLKRNPDFYVNKEEPKKQEEPIKTELKLPDKVTLKWLWEYVPHSFWALLGTLLIGAFGLGVKFAETDLYKSLINPTTATKNIAVQNNRSSAVKK